MKFLQTICFGLAMGFCASCAHFTSNLSPAAKPHPQSAILYGRLALRPTFSAGLKMALWLQNEDTQASSYIPFSESHPFYVIQVKPGNYRIAGFLATNRSHQILDRQLFFMAGPGDRITKPFAAGPGSQTYLGDFTAEATLNDIIGHWQIDGITNNFAATTVEFREKYPSFAQVPAVSVFEAQSIDTPDYRDLIRASKQR